MLPICVPESITPLGGLGRLLHLVRFRLCEGLLQCIFQAMNRKIPWKVLFIQAIGSSCFFGLFRPLLNKASDCSCTVTQITQFETGVFGPCDLHHKSMGSKQDTDRSQNLLEVLRNLLPHHAFNWGYLNVLRVGVAKLEILDVPHFAALSLGLTWLYRSWGLLLERPWRWSWTTEPTETAGWPCLI